MSPYSPTINPGDAINLAMSKRPGRTAGGIAVREAGKYGVSNLGENFYDNNRFTASGGALTGGISGAGSAMLHGAPAGEVAKRGALGAGIGGAASGVSDYALSNGASAAGAAGAAGAVGATGNIAAHMAMGDEMSGSDIASGVAAPIAGGIAAGAGAGTAAGPIGIAIGAVIGLLQSLSPHVPRVKGEIKVDGPLFSYDPKTKKFRQTGKITGFESTGFHGGAVPKKHWNTIVHAAKRRANYINSQLAGKTFVLTPRNQAEVTNMINSSILSMPHARRSNIRSWINDPSYDNFNPSSIDSLAGNPANYLTRFGKIDNYSNYDGMDEGGDAPPPPMFNNDGSRYVNETDTGEGGDANDDTNQRPFWEN